MNQFGTCYLRIEKKSGEGVAKGCRARIISQKLDIDHETIWNINPYPRIHDIADYSDIVLFTFRKDPRVRIYSDKDAMTREGLYLIFYVAKEEEGYEEKEVRLDANPSEVSLRVVANVQEGKPPKPFEDTLNKIVNQATLTTSAGELGNPHRRFSV